MPACKSGSTSGWTCGVVTADKVTESVNDFLAPIRERRMELAGDMDYVKDVLREGNRRANEIANQTLEEVREAMGMVY